MGVSKIKGKWKDDCSLLGQERPRRTAQFEGRVLLKGGDQTSVLDMKIEVTLDIKWRSQ